MKRLLGVPDESVAIARMLALGHPVHHPTPVAPGTGRRVSHHRRPLLGSPRKDPPPGGTLTGGRQGREGTDRGGHRPPLRRRIPPA